MTVLLKISFYFAQLNSNWQSLFDILTHLSFVRYIYLCFDHIFYILLTKYGFRSKTLIDRKLQLLI